MSRNSSVPLNAVCLKKELNEKCSVILQEYCQRWNSISNRASYDRCGKCHQWREKKCKCKVPAGGTWFVQCLAHLNKGWEQDFGNAPKFIIFFQAILGGFFVSLETSSVLWGKGWVFFCFCGWLFCALMFAGCCVNMNTNWINSESLQGHNDLTAPLFRIYTGILFYINSHL